MNTAAFWSWVNERHAIYLRKTTLEGRSPPAWANPHKARGKEKWTLDHLTDDPVMSQYRFCNVFRELDRVTDWIRINIREPFADHPHLWFMLAIARTFNWPETLELLIVNSEVNWSWPDSKMFEPRFIAEVIEEAQQQGQHPKIYTGAYMIRAESNKKAPWYDWSKQRYVAEIVLGRLWEDRKDWLRFFETNPSVESVWKRFQDKRYIGWGSFMAYQVVVDMCHTHYLEEAFKREPFAALGPGSRRGLNRLLGVSPDAGLSQDHGLALMKELQAEQAKNRAKWVPPIHIGDIQNCLCEYDKWQRVAQGEGRPRAKWVVGRGY